MCYLQGNARIYKKLIHSIFKGNESDYFQQV